VVSHSVGFPTTDGSLIIVAGDRAVPEARAALAELCKTYWYPVYALIRRRNHLPDEASEHKLRRRFRTLLEHEIAATLADPSDLDEEVRWLFEAIRS
jgi:hypothetical protein